MATKDFTKEQLKKLQQNPNVLSATEKRIVYTTEFKKKFIEEYRKGLGPREIFIKAGFDVDALGYKRIERASDRWRMAYNQGMLGENEDFLPVHRDRNKETKIDQLEKELKELRQELKALRG